MIKFGAQSDIERRAFLKGAALAMGGMLVDSNALYSSTAEGNRSTPEGPLPDWMRGARMFCLEGHSFDLRETPINIPDLCHTIAKSGGTLLRMTAHTYMDYVYYDGNSGCLKAPGLGAGDWFAVGRTECDRLGIKLIAYFDVEGYLPDSPHYGKFDIKDEEGKPVGWYTGNWRGACLNWPAWYDLNLRIMQEVVQKYSIDGLYLDEDYYELCYCEQCKKSFHAYAGIPIPDARTLARNGVPFDYPGFVEPAADIPDPAARKYAEWRYKLTVDLTINIFNSVRALKPDILTLYHLHPEDRSLPYYAGTLIEGGERNRPDWTWRSGYLANSISAFPIPVFVDMYNNTGISRSEYKLKCAQVFTNGCYPAVIPVPFSDPRPLSGASEIFRVVEKYKEYFDFRLTQVVRFVVLPRSSMGGGLIRDSLVEAKYPIGVNGLLGPGNGPLKIDLSLRGWPATEEQRFTSPRIGAYGALALSGMLMSNMAPQEKFAGDLSTYKVLCLANQGAMSDAEVELVRRFVAAGGGLIATHETSLYRNDGSKRADFGLADVFGVHYAATDRYIGVVGGYRVNFKVTQPHPVNEKLPVGVPIRNCDLVVPVKVGKAESIASIVQPRGTYYSENARGFVGTLRDSLMAGPEIGPAVTVHQFGKGRVIYFAGRPGSMYLLWAIPEMQMWLKNAVNWVSWGDVPVRVQAEAHVSIGLFRQPTRHVLHVVNMSIAATPVDAVPDLTDVELLVKLPPELRLRRVWGLVSESNLSYRVENDKVKIILPRLHEYEVIALEHA